jgi:hypothetical protein
LQITGYTLSDNTSIKKDAFTLTIDKHIHPQTKCTQEFASVQPLNLTQELQSWPNSTHHTITESKTICLMTDLNIHSFFHKRDQHLYKITDYTLSDDEFASVQPLKLTQELQSWPNSTHHAEGRVDPKVLAQKKGY